MYRKEVNQKSPLRILERSIHGGLGAGNLGVVMARAGVGKTAFLVQVGLDDLMREKDVLHVTLGQSVEHAQSWYDGLFDDLAEDVNLDNRETVRAGITKRRIIQAYPGGQLDPQTLEKAAALYSDRLNLKFSVLVIDGFQWEGDVVSVAANLGALKALARGLGAELWISAQTHRGATGPHPEIIPAPCAAFADVIDVAVYLEPQGQHVSVRLLKDHNNPEVSETHLLLEPDTLQLSTEEADIEAAKLSSRAYTLLSGAAKGAESEFGALAEEWGLTELNFSFAGRTTERTRGVVELTDAELAQGRVSPSYLKAQLHRQFPKTPQFQKMLHTIWHQVATSGQIFVVGLIQTDGTVSGGTGWAAELGKHFGRPVLVYDQEKRSWFSWTGDGWNPEEHPKINRTRFTGTGTRFLSDDGKAAIRQLFVDSFGEAPRVVVDA